jgi:hypothetical protein
VGLILAKPEPDGLRPYWWPLSFKGPAPAALDLLRAFWEGLTPLLDHPVLPALDADQALQGHPVSPYTPLDLTSPLRPALEAGGLVDCLIRACEERLGLFPIVTHLSFRSARFPSAPTSWTDLRPPSVSATVPYSEKLEINRHQQLNWLLAHALRRAFPPSWAWFGQAFDESDPPSNKTPIPQLKPVDLGIHTRSFSYSAHMQIQTQTLLEDLLGLDIPNPGTKPLKRR